MEHIGSWQLTEVKRRDPGWVDFSLNICSSLSKLINPLWFGPRRVPHFYLLVKMAGRVSPAPSLNSHPGVNGPGTPVTNYLPVPSTNSCSTQLTTFANIFEVFFGDGHPCDGTALNLACTAKGTTSYLSGKS